jgi:hypothetical protein
MKPAVERFLTQVKKDRGFDEKTENSIREIIDNYSPVLKYFDKIEKEKLALALVYLACDEEGVASLEYFVDKFSAKKSEILKISDDLLKKRVSPKGQVLKEPYNL